MERRLGRGSNLVSSVPLWYYLINSPFLCCQPSGCKVGPLFILDCAFLVVEWSVVWCSRRCIWQRSRLTNVRMIVWLLNEWVIDWLNDWVIEWMNDWMSEWANWANVWANEWLAGLVGWDWIAAVQTYTHAHIISNIFLAFQCFNFAAHFFFAQSVNNENLTCICLFYEYDITTQRNLIARCEYPLMCRGEARGGREKAFPRFSGVLNFKLVFLRYLIGGSCAIVCWGSRNNCTSPGAFPTTLNLINTHCRISMHRG
jgi:hypothetical protein